MDSRVEKLISSISNLRKFDISSDDLNSVKENINRIFITKAKCRRFIFTKNTDKLPFGCIVFPNLTDDDIYELYASGTNPAVNDYDVELDSKMFDYGLSDEEIVTMILFNVYYTINSSKAYEEVREAIDSILVDNCACINTANVVYALHLLKFGLLDTLNQITSCLYLPNEVESDPFLESLELDNLKEMLDKVYRQIPGCDNEVTRLPNLKALEWAIKSYNNINTERSAIGHLMMKCKDITASRLYNEKFDDVISSINNTAPSVDFVTSVKNNILSESAKKIGLLSRLKYNGLRDIENDLYEFNIRAKNAENEQDVFYALKQINARLAILDDFIRENPEDEEIERWIGVKMEYLEIRDVLARKKLHKASYGIFIDYDKIFNQDSDVE